MDSAVLLLLVEDEPLLLMSARETLADGGFAVRESSGGADAMRLLDDGHREFAGLITDIRLGDGPDGWEVARHARLLKPDIAIVYTTGDSAHHWDAEGVPRSVILVKPFAEAQLLTAIAGLLNQGDG